MNLEEMEKTISDLQKVKVNWGIQIKHWFEEYYNPRVDKLEEVLRELKEGTINMLTDIKAHRGLRLHETIFLENLKKLDVGFARQTEKKEYNHKLMKWFDKKIEDSGGEKEIVSRCCACRKSIDDQNAVYFSNRNWICDKCINIVCDEWFDDYLEWKKEKEDSRGEKEGKEVATTPRKDMEEEICMQSVHEPTSKLPELKTVEVKWEDLQFLIDLESRINPDELTQEEKRKHKRIKEEYKTEPENKYPKVVYQLGSDSKEYIELKEKYDKLIEEFLKRIDWIMQRIFFHTENPDSELMDEVSEEYKEWKGRLKE